MHKRERVFCKLASNSWIKNGFRSWREFGHHLLAEFYQLILFFCGVIYPRYGVIVSYCFIGGVWRVLS